MRPRGVTAMEVVRLCDGTRTAHDIARIMDVSTAYVRKTAARRGVSHLLVVTPRGFGITAQLRRAEFERDAYKSVSEKLAAELGEMRKDLRRARNQLDELQRQVLAGR